MEVGGGIMQREHLQLLLADVDEWNRWREQNSAVRPLLKAADLTGANLVFANLSHSDLRQANLTLADLKGADLRGADLRGANLVGARLIGVDLAGANICGADLGTAEDLTTEELEDAIGDENTKLPEGTLRPASWVQEHPAVYPNSARPN
jgi:hypothetical protein